MLCPVLTCRTAEELLTEQRQWMAEGARLVEWRLDHVQETLNLPALLAARPGPVIVTVRRPEDGGLWRGEEEQRRALLRQAVAAGVEYVDLEPDAADAIPRSGATQRIVSRHDFQGTPADLYSLYEELASHDADIVKLATLATCISRRRRLRCPTSNSSRPGFSSRSA